MSQAIQTGSITPADVLRALLVQVEKRIVTPYATQADTLQLLHELDQIAALWPVLQAHGADLQPEAGRWESIQSAVHRHAPRIVRTLRGARGFAAARQNAHPDGGAAWWWNLDAEVQQLQRRRLTRAGIIFGVALVALVGVNLLLRLLFPVDPGVREATLALDSGDDKVAQGGDFQGARADFERAVTANPNDGEAWLRLGVAREKLGDASGAEDAYRRASNLITDPGDYHLAHGGSYFALGLLVEAERELRAGLALAPDNPYIFYYLASVFEAQGNATGAIDALTEAARFAEEQKNDEIMVMARYRLGILMQQPRLDATPAPSPTP